MTKNKTECPDCGHEYEIELDKSISEVISQGIENGKTNLSESEKDKIKEEAAKNTLSAQKLINKKEIEDLRAHFTKKFEDQEERHKDEKKDLEDKRNKFRERVGKIGGKIVNIGNQKSYDDGRLQEEDIEKFLIKKYKPLGDDIEPVPDGEEGADIIHTVNYKGNLIGKIVVESKNTQSFSKKYEEKSFSKNYLFRVSYLFHTFLGSCGFLCRTPIRLCFPIVYKNVPPFDTYSLFSSDSQLTGPLI